MSESSGKAEQVKNPGRRKFLKTAVKVAVAGVGTAALGGIVANEVINKDEGSIVTESGTFFPLYELHSKGIKVESIPNNLDVFFGELPTRKTFLLAPQDILLNIESKNLAFLSQKKTEIMFGDVDLPWNEKDLDRLIIVGEVLVGAGMGVTASDMDHVLGKVYSEADISRRKFLKVVLLAGAAWGLAKIPLMAGLFLEPYNKNVIDRIFNRLMAIDSHMHPELSVDFFRNIVMADKLLTVSEDIGKRTGKKARIAFNVGAAHSGIEDFLQAGHDFCRSLILAYPKLYLRSAVDLNNGIKDFCSARLLKLPENLTEGDVGSGEKLSLTTERRVVDEKLERALTLKLT